MNAKQVVQIGLLASAAIVLHVIETWLPVPAPVPGIKLGLANSVALFALAVIGMRAALYISIIRVLLGALVGGIFLGPAFVMSAAGGLGSILVMGHADYHWKPPFSVIGVSILGAVTHSVVQVCTAAILVSSLSLLWYIPYVILFAIPTGVVTGLTAAYFLERMPEYR